MTSLPPFAERLDSHRERRSQHEAEAARNEALENRISGIRLITFLVGGGALTTALATDAGITAGALAIVAAVAFLAAVVVQSRVAERRAKASARALAHARHLQRAEGGFPGRDGSLLLPGDHIYARDIDLVGQSSLVSRIDVTHTVRGAQMLVQSLSSPLPIDEARRRQAAVRELATLPEFRVELEVSAAQRGQWERDLDDAPFLRFIAAPGLLAEKPWLRIVTFVLPAITLCAFVVSRVFGMSNLVWLVPVLVQLGLLRAYSARARAAQEWLTARMGFAEAFVQLMETVLGREYESALLQEIQSDLRMQGGDAVQQMRRLARIEGLAQLRTQGPVYLVVNALTLWDFWCQDRLEAWARDVGPHCKGWFDALGLLEALSSLATLAETDPDASFPELSESGALELEGLAHPLLDPRTRVGNDLRLSGPRSAWVVTGSNMAGKSTLLRSVGLSIALGLAGGPIVARRGRVPRVRLRASMRIDDSLQRGASYFRAELNKLQSVVAGLGADPPVFFLLDEVLRGTNSRARSVGARSVVTHLLHRSAFGLVATHDASLADLAQDSLLDVHNCHFTDVFEQGEMRFDYRLRPGVVETSNALRLLQMAGIEVLDPDAPASTGLGAAPGDASESSAEEANVR